MKYTLTLKQTLPFAQNPRFCELEGEKILLNDVMLPASIDASASYNPHNVRLFVIGHEFGAICAVWASNAQDAFDNAVDANMLDCLMCEDQNPNEEDEEDLARLGNAGELFDLSYAWIGEVEFDAARDIKLIVSIVRATESQQNTIED